MDDDLPSDNERPKIEEQPVTGCIVFFVSLGTAFVLMLVATYGFERSDERAATMWFMSVIIGFVGSIWGVVLRERAKRE